MKEFKRPVKIFSFEIFATMYLSKQRLHYEKMGFVRSRKNGKHFISIR